MRDISTQWAGTYGDYCLENGQLCNCDDLATAVLLSVFSDSALTPDEVIPDGTNDPRGWWGDASLGSKVWTLMRAKRTQETLAQAKDFITESLRWMIDDGVAAAVDVYCEWEDPSQLSAEVTVRRSDGTTLPLRFAWAWAPEQCGEVEAFNASGGIGGTDKTLAGAGAGQGTGTGALPTGPSDPSFANVILLNLFDEVPLLDYSQYHKTMVLETNASIQSTVSAVGGFAMARPASAAASAYTNPAGTGYPSGHAFGAGDFTAEGWLRRTGADPSPQFVIADGTGRTVLIVGSGLVTNDRISAWMNFDGTTWGLKLEAGAGSMPSNTWVPWCVMRVGTTIYFLLGGTVAASGTFSGSIDPSGFDFSTSYVSYGGGGAGYQGHVDQTRLTRAVARYNPATGYTVSTSPFLTS